MVNREQFGVSHAITHQKERELNNRRGKRRKNLRHLDLRQNAEHPLVIAISKLSFPDPLFD